jgi:hypothetical protein
LSLFLDRKYVLLVSHRLPLFKDKGRNVWNFRCPLCGDSKKKKQKARGYAYSKGNDIFMSCHNCGVSMYWGSFLKEIDPALYQQYVYEKFAETGGGRGVSHAKADDLFKTAEPVFKTKDIGDVFHEAILEEVGIEAERLLNEMWPFPALDTLPEDHEAIKYVINRKIPKHQWSRLVYIEHTNDIIKSFPQYETLKHNKEARIGIPVYGIDPDMPENDRMRVGVAMRALDDHSMRYINVRDEAYTGNMIFGIEQVDFDKPVIVVEGALDSLFLPNAIAVAGTSFGKLEDLDFINKNLTIVFDNEKRNKEVVKLMKKYIDKGYQVCIWPCENNIKDINQMVMCGMSPDDVLYTIKNNSYVGLMADLKFTEWRKC